MEHLTAVNRIKLGDSWVIEIELHLAIFVEWLRIGQMSPAMQQYFYRENICYATNMIFEQHLADCDNSKHCWPPTAVKISRWCVAATV